MFVPPEWWARGLPHGDGGSGVITARAPNSVSLPGTTSLPRPKVSIAARNCITAKTQNRYRCQELHHCQDPVDKTGVTARNRITAKIL
jgi:hypothetical protein